MEYAVKHTCRSSYPYLVFFLTFKFLPLHRDKEIHTKQSFLSLNSVGRLWGALDRIHRNLHPFPVPGQHARVVPLVMPFVEMHLVVYLALLFLALVLVELVLHPSQSCISIRSFWGVPCVLHCGQYGASLAAFYALRPFPCVVFPCVPHWVFHFGENWSF